jgi:multidrug transporter EmrE-like cation transporter
MSNTQKRINEIEEQIGTLENNLRTVKKVTPMHDRTWYVKWFSVMLICAAVLCRSVDEVPKIYDVIFSAIGTAGWLYVGFSWHDRALIVLNTILLSMLATGLFRYFIMYF